MSYDFLYKIIVLGQAYNGKTSIIDRIVRDKFHTTYQNTIGIDFSSTTRKVSEIDKTIKFHIWDTAGGKEWMSIIEVYYKSVAVPMIIMDCTCKNAFEDAQDWLKLWNYKKSYDCNTPPIIITTKIDLCDKRIYSKEEGEMFATENGCKYYEVSALTGSNTKYLLEKIANHIWENNGNTSSTGIVSNLYLDLREEERRFRDGSYTSYLNCCKLQ
jgi:small GTP-binding protein